ncbi:hypothetical protein [uncultured Thiodictyon sp.]|uniref:hypothetical protein n=1 Tax=uncultured Thiodictyon sp. TaxID=1846217 RepID=UPI0025FDAF3C|nr:hypothetical protein [uncultured Thiodictyon sp.]
MANTRAPLIDLRDRLLACAAAVPPRAESFHRELTALLAEVEGALSWRGVLGRGQSAPRLAPRVAALAARGEALHGLFDRLARIEGQLAAAAQSLERIAAPALRQPDCIPAMLGHLGAETRRLGRQVRTDDDLMVDQRRCETTGVASARLTQALALWLSAETVLTRIRASSRTAALEAALPELGERLCRTGPTPDWQAEVKALVDPLEQLASRAQPREITQTQLIIKALPRWARALGEDCDAGDALAERFTARRKDWPGEDDRTFEELFEQARALEQDLVERAAERRRAGLADLGARCALFAQLVGAAPDLDELVQDLSAETPDNPRDHEDWCEQLRDAEEAFQNRVKRSETALLATFSADLGDCRTRLEALGATPRQLARDAELARLRDGFERLARTGPGIDPLSLLNQVEGARGLRADLEALEAGLREDDAALAAAHADLERRRRWLEERAPGLGIAVPAMTVDNQVSGAAPLPGAAGALLARQERLLSDAEARFAQVGREAIEAVNRRIGQLLTVLTPERTGAAGLDLAAIPPAPDGGLGRIDDTLGQVRTRLAALESLAADEEQSLTAAAAHMRQALELIPAAPLGRHDRDDREALLRQLQQWRPGTPADPVERLTALRELIENARHIEQRIASVARQLQARREALGEGLRRFNGLFLQGYCPDLYGRVEALVHPPAQTRWPRGAEAGQLQEAERLFRLLERQAQRLAAREIGETLQVLERQARRGADPRVQALVAAVQGLPPEQPPPARLRRQLAEQLRALGLERP